MESLYYFHPDCIHEMAFVSSYSLLYELSISCKSLSKYILFFTHYDSHNYKNLESFKNVKSIKLFPSSHLGFNSYRLTFVKSLHFNKYVQLCEPFATFRNLEKLHLEYCKNFITLTYFTNLRSLMFQDSIKINTISYLTKLTKLKLYNNPRIVSIQNLTKLCNLTLHGSPNKIISSLVHLTSLELKACTVYGINNLINLQKISLIGYNKMNLIILLKLTNLTAVKLIEIGEMTNLTRLNLLRRLKIAHQSIKSYVSSSVVTSLFNFVKLKTLSLEHTPIFKLSNMYSLTELKLKYNSIHDFGNLTNIQKLFIENSNIILPEHITRLKILTYLSLINCNITNISMMISLRILTVNKTKVNRLYKLFNVEKLHLIKCSSVASINKMFNLTELILEKTHVQNVNTLSNLIILKICNNVSIPSIQRLDRLKQLFASYTVVDKIKYLTSLEKLHLHFTHTTKIESLDCLHELYFHQDFGDAYMTKRMKLLEDTNVTIDDISNLINLRILSLKGNRLIRNLNTLTNLVRVYLGYNLYATNLYNLKRLKYVESRYHSENRINIVLPEHMF